MTILGTWEVYLFRDTGYNGHLNYIWKSLISKVTPILPVEGDSVFSDYKNVCASPFLEELRAEYSGQFSSGKRKSLKRKELSLSTYNRPSRKQRLLQRSRTKQQ